MYVAMIPATKLQPNVLLMISPTPMSTLSSGGHPGGVNIHKASNMNDHPVILLMVVDDIILGIIPVKKQLSVKFQWDRELYQ